MLSAVLKAHGHEVKLLHINNERAIPFKKEPILRMVKDFQPDLVGMSATTFEFDSANVIAKWLKDEGITIPIILGGIHATIEPDDLWDSNFDGFCIGEGEIPLLSLINNLGLSLWTATPGFWFKDGKCKFMNPILPYVTDLNSLPFHDFDVINTPDLLDFREGWISISFSRGCPFNCSFCANPLLRKISGDNKHYCRVRTPEIAISELLYLIMKFPQIKCINLDDDLLMMRKEWMLTFCKLYKEHIFEPRHIEFILNCRVDTLDDDIAKILKESGCRELKIGVESGDPTIRNGILKKRVTDEQIINAFDLTHKYNLNTTAYLIMGIPGETAETMEKTFTFLRIIRPTLTRVAFLQPYRGTEIYDECVRQELLPAKHIQNWHEESPLILKTLSSTDLIMYKFLLPWHLNADLDGYAEAAKKYQYMSYEEFRQKIPELIREDAELSKKQKGPHFRYFPKNRDYIEYYRPGK